MNRTALFSVLACLLTGCAGSSGSVIPGAITAAGATKAGSVALTITVPRPNAQSTVRHAAYISPATQSVSVKPQGGATQTFPIASSSPNCSTGNGGLTCTFSVSAPVGQNALVISTYADAAGSGAPLSTATIAVNVIPGQTNPVNATLNGVVAAILLTLNPGQVTPGTAATAQVVLTATDASGNAIIGPGGYADATGNPVTIVLTDADSSNSTTLSQTSVTKPSSGITLAYNGSSSFVKADITVATSAAGVASRTATLTAVTAATGCPLPPATPALFLLYGGDGIATVPLGQTGVFSPSSRFAVPAPEYEGIAVDRQGSIYLTAGDVEIFCTLSTGTPNPVRTFQISSSGTTPAGEAFDPNGNLFVALTAANNGSANQGPGASSVDNFAPGVGTSTPSVPTPQGVLAGPATQLVGTGDLAFGNGLLYARNFDTVTAYASTNGNVPPSLTLASPNAGLVRPIDVASDPAGNVYILYQNDYRAGGTGGFAIARFPSGTTTPSNVITTQVGQVLGSPGIAVALAADAVGNVYVANVPLNPGSTQTSVSKYSGSSTAGPTAQFDTTGTIFRGNIGFGVSPGTPVSLAVDGSQTVYVGGTSGKVLVYTLGTGGNYFPVRYIGGDNGTTSMLGTISFIAVDAAGTLYAASQHTGIDTTVQIYAPGADCVPTGAAGNGPPPPSCAPIRTVPNSGIGSAPGGIAVDATGTLYVSDSSPANKASIVRAFAAGASAATRTIDDAFAAQALPRRLAVDAAGNVALIGAVLQGAFGYPAGTSGTAVATRQLTNLAPSTRSSGFPSSAINYAGRGVAIDAAGNVYVAGGLSNSISVYAANATVPTYAITGPHTRLLDPRALAVDSNGTVYVGTLASELLVFPAGSKNDAVPQVLNVGFRVSGLAIGPGPVGTSSTANRRLRR